MTMETDSAYRERVIAAKNSAGHFVATGDPVHTASGKDLDVIGEAYLQLRRVVTGLHADGCQCFTCQAARIPIGPDDGGPAFPQTIVSMQAAPNMNGINYGHAMMTGDPALNPFAHTWTSGGGGISIFPAAPGMPLRDYFAGQFAMGAGADDSPLDVSHDATPDDIDAAMKANFDQVAKASYMFADAMLKARKG